jgi:hypothetical protein
MATACPVSISEGGPSPSPQASVTGGVEDMSPLAETMTSATRRSAAAATGDPASPVPDAPTTAYAPPHDPSPAQAVAQLLPMATTSPLPATASDQTASPQATSAQPASPAAQIAPALVRIAHASDGTQHLTVRLQPPELGQVQVRIDRPQEAPARVEITVEKQETLTLLLRDQPQLQRALDQAGVPPEGRSVTFHVAPVDQPARSEPATAPAPGVAAGGPSSDGSHGMPRNGGQAARQAADTSEETVLESIPAMLSGWIRGGLDITA